MSQKTKLSNQWVGPGLPEAREFQDAIFDWQSGGHCVLGRQRNNFVDIFTKR